MLQILKSRISVAFTDSWSDHAKDMLEICGDIFTKIPEIKRIIILASKQSVENEWLPFIRGATPKNGLTCAIGIGKLKRKRAALSSDKQVFITNDESLAWMKKACISHGDLIVIDELSHYRHMKSERYRCVRRLCRLAGRVVAFTRIALPIGLYELWEEFYLLDGGMRLGRTKTDFLDRYFFINRIWTNKHVKIYVEAKPSAVSAIARAVEDICINLVQREEMQLMPQLRDVYVELSPSEMSRYHMMASENSVSLGFRKELSVSESCLTARTLLQMASGTICDSQKKVHHFHDRKIMALRMLIEEMKDENVLIVYSYHHEMEHIKENFPQALVLSDIEDIRKWNEGQIKIGLVNSSKQSMYGDMNKGGHIIVWFSIAWSLGIYAKTNERIAGGFEKPVIIRLIARNTIDEKVVKVISSCQDCNSEWISKVGKERLDE